MGRGRERKRGRERGVREGWGSSLGAEAVDGLCPDVARRLRCASATPHRPSTLRSHWSASVTNKRDAEEEGRGLRARRR